MSRWPQWLTNRWPQWPHGRFRRWLRGRFPEWLRGRLPHLTVTSAGWRFLLLTAVVTASSVAMFNELLTPEPNDTPGDALGCMLAAGLNPDGYHLDNLRAMSRYPEAMASCLQGVPTVLYWKGMVGTLGVFAVAALLYWWLPRWRNRSTLPVEAVDADGSLGAELAGLGALTGTERQIHFRVDPTRTTGGAVAYGRAGRYVVALHGGLLTRRHTDPDLFRAVVLHELAHVRNRDVGFAYGGLALWRAFTALVFLPAMFQSGLRIFEGVTGATSSPFWPGAAPILLKELAEGVVLALLVHLARADLLRQRELHADARAVGWGATPAAWNHPDSEVGTGSALALRRLGRVLGTHPSWARRRAVLADPRRLRAVGAPEMLLTGLASWLLFQQLVVVPGISTDARSVWVVVALVAPVFWIAVRRSAEAADAAGAAGAAGGELRRAVPGAAAGLSLGLGLSIGELVRGAGGNEWLPYNPYYLVFFLLVGTVPAVWLAQSDRVASLLPRPGLRGAVRLLGGAVALVLLWEGLRWWLSVGRLHLAGSHDRLYQGTAGPRPEFAWEDVALTRFAVNAEHSSASPVLAVAVMSMWLLPLLASALGANVVRRTTLVAGVAGALLSWAAVGGAASILIGRRPGGVGVSVEVVAAMQWWMLVATVVSCVITACAVAALTSEHWMIRALTAAGITHLGGLAGGYVFYAADGCFGPLNVLTNQCRWKPGNGWLGMTALAEWSLITAGLLSACAALTVGIASRALRPRAPGAPGATVPVGPVDTVGAVGAVGPVGAVGAVRRERTGPGRRPARSAVTAALAMAAAAALFATFTVPRPEPATPSDPSAHVPDLLPAAPPAQSALIRKWQVLAWELHGGYDHMQRLADQARIISDAVTDATEEPRSGPGIKLDTERFRQLCGALGEQVAQAQRYFPVPDPDAQALWSAGLADLGRSARDCRAALDGGDGRRFIAALEDMATALRALLAAAKLVWEIAGHSTQPAD